MVLGIKHNMNRIFLSNQVFLKNRNWHDADVLHRAQAQKKHIKLLRENHGDPHDQFKQTIVSHTQIKLPFVCNNIFDPKVVPYPGTGVDFTRFTWNGDDGKIEVLTKMEIVLAQKDRERGVPNTPQQTNDISLDEMNVEDLYD